ncbi:MAG: transposase [Rubrivivax sp.]
MYSHRRSRGATQAAGPAAVQVGQPVLGNLKTMISGSYKAFGYGKYAGRYLGAFAYRFNRRFDLADLVVRLVVDVCRSAPSPERLIRQA